MRSWQWLGFVALSACVSKVQDYPRRADDPIPQPVDMAAPTITSINGTGVPDDQADHAPNTLQDRLIITGSNFTDATVTWRAQDAAEAVELEVCERTESSLSVLPPAGTTLGQYVLSVANQAGCNEAPVTIIEPQIALLTGNTVTIQPEAGSPTGAVSTLQWSNGEAEPFLSIGQGNQGAKISSLDRLEVQTDQIIVTRRTSDSSTPRVGGLFRNTSFSPESFSDPLTYFIEDYYVGPDALVWEAGTGNQGFAISARGWTSETTFLGGRNAAILVVSGSDMPPPEFSDGRLTNPPDSRTAGVLFAVDHRGVSVGVRPPASNDEKLTVAGDAFITGGIKARSFRTGVSVLNEDSLLIGSFARIEPDPDGPAKLWINGTGNFTGQLSVASLEDRSQASDLRLKKDLQPLHNVLDDVSKLRGLRYHWADPSRGTESQIGVIAQEVEGAFPELVHTDSKGMKSVDYARLSAVLVEATKELRAELQKQQQRIARLESALAATGSGSVPKASRTP